MARTGTQFHKLCTMLEKQKNGKIKVSLQAFYGKECASIVPILKALLAEIEIHALGFLKRFWKTRIEVRKNKLNVCKKAKRKNPFIHIIKRICMYTQPHICRLKNRKQKDSRNSRQNGNFLFEAVNDHLSLLFH